MYTPLTFIHQRIPHFAYDPKTVYFKPIYNFIKTTPQQQSVKSTSK